MNILVATKNSAKIEGAKQAFEKYYTNFNIEGISVPSDVPDQPVDFDIYLGAKNRAEHLFDYARQNKIEFDFCVAIESGITNKLGEWEVVNVAIIIDKNGKQSFGTSAGFPVPEKYVDKIIKTSLGDVMDEMFNANNIRAQKGGINFLTNGVVTRIDISRDAFIMALTRFVNEYWN